jgi:hypothetical protein
LRGTNRLIISLLLLVLGAGIVWLQGQIPELTESFGTNIGGLTAVFLPFALFTLFLFAILGADDILRQLYMSAEMELLMIVPLSQRDIFSARLLFASRALLPPALLIGIFLYLIGRLQQAPVVYYLLCVVLLVAAVGLVITIIMSLVILLARILPPRRVRGWIPGAIALSLLVLTLLQRPATDWLLTQEKVLDLLTQSFADPTRLALLTAGFWAVTLAVIGMGYQIFNRTFFESWNRFYQVPSQGKRRASGFFGRLALLFPEPLRTFMVKEWLVLRRDPGGLLSLSLPVVYVVLTLAPLVGFDTAESPLRPFFYWYILLFFSILTVTLPTGAPLLSLLNEGRNIALLQSTPASISTALKAKFLVTWLPAFFTLIIVVSGAGWWLDFPTGQTIFLIGAVLGALAGASISTLALGGLTADFTVEDVKRRMPRLPGYLAILLNALFVFLVVLLAITLQIQLFPESEQIAILQSLSNFRVIGWLMSSTWILPGSLILLLAVYMIGAGFLWKKAVYRLSHWE